MRTELKNRIELALEQLRPFLQADGGDVSLLEITDDNIVRIEFLGACKSCSMNLMTFKAGIEEAIRKAAPEIVSVEAVNLIVVPVVK
ncbi:MAG: NifU family protein [Bacteroidetes bacterium]|jgi:Fe-S cluster biogenesis protein NfuA|nr:NifU family protein [Bacteroidota bacterium]